MLQPSVEHVVQAQNVEQRDGEDGDGLGVDAEVLHSDLAGALTRSPVDIEEVRRYLAAAARVGLDLEALYPRAVAAELPARPLRVPSMPPAGRDRLRDWPRRGVGGYGVNGQGDTPGSAWRTPS